MEAIKRLFSGSTPPDTASKPIRETQDSFSATRSPSLIEKLEQEHVRLKAAFETQFGKPIAELRNKHAEALRDVERFKDVKAMDPETWSTHLDFALNRLSEPESLSPQDLEGLKKMVAALEAAPPVYLSPRQTVLLATVLVFWNVEHPEPTQEDPEQEEHELRQNIQQEAKSRSYELALQQRLEQTTLELEESAKDPALSTQLAALNEIEHRISLAQKEEEERAILADKTRRDRATIGYQERAKKLADMSTETRDLVQRLKEPSLETEKVALQDALVAQQHKFLEALNDLETWDLNAKIAQQGEDPYSSAVSLPSTTQLVREYQLARHGISNIVEAYKKLIPTGVPDLNELWKSMSVETLTNFLQQARDLARDYPLECADLAANLAHTYSILTMNGGITAEIQTILDRRTAENQVVDAILGQQTAVYSTGELKKIPLKQLALIDLCNRAPYIAGALMHEHMTGAKAARAAAAWIPGLGSWAPVQMGAGIGGAIAQVRGQKELARRISRRYEVMANSMLAALKGYQHGGMTGAIQQARSYALSRQMIRNAGDFFRTAVETGNITGAITDQFLRGWRQNPAAEAVKAAAAWGTGALVGIPTLGSAVIAAGGTLTAGTVAFPLTVAAAAAVTARTAANAIHDRYFKSEAQKLNEKQKQTADRLKRAYDELKKKDANLPALTGADFSQAAAAQKPEEVMVQVVDRKLEQQQNTEYSALATRAHVDSQVVGATLKTLAERTSP